MINAAQKRELQKRQKSEESKKRTHRLCQVGGAVESVLGCPIEEEDIPKTVGFDAMLVVLWWYAIVTTIFAAMRSKAFLSDFTAFVDTVWNGICQFGKWIISVGRYVARLADKIPNEQVTVMVHGLLLIIVIVALTGGAGILLTIIGKKAVKMYQENCRDVVSVEVVVTSMAIVVYFGDRIKDIIGLNLMIILLLVQVVYVGIRVYVNGCKKARGYY